MRDAGVPTVRGNAHDTPSPGRNAPTRPQLPIRGTDCGAATTGRLPSAADESECAGKKGAEWIFCGMSKFRIFHRPKTHPASFEK